MILCLEMISPKHLVNPSFHAAAFEVNFRKASANLPKAGWSKHLLLKVRRTFAKAAASKVFARNAGSGKPRPSNKPLRISMAARRAALRRLDAKERSLRRLLFCRIRIGIARDDGAEAEAKAKTTKRFEPTTRQRRGWQWSSMYRT